MFRKIVTALVITALFVLLTGCITKPQLPKTDIAIWDTHQDQWIEESTLVSGLKEANYVVVGELHQSHQLRDRFLAVLQQLEDDQWLQVVALDVLQPKLNSDTNSYMEQLEQQAPHLLANYQLIVEWIEKEGIPLVAAAIPQDRIKSMQGKEAQQWLNQEIAGALSPSATHELRAILGKAHSASSQENKVIDEKADYLLAAQQLQDYFMARMLQALKQQTVLVTRAFHARKDLGVAPYIRLSQPNAKIKSVLMVSSMDDRESLMNQLMEVDKQYDYIWLKFSDRGLLLAPEVIQDKTSENK